MFVKYYWCSFYKLSLADGCFKCFYPTSGFKMPVREEEVRSVTRKAPNERAENENFEMVAGGIAWPLFRPMFKVWKLISKPNLTALARC
jgi:hypothetical protein